MGERQEEMVWIPPMTLLLPFPTTTITTHPHAIALLGVFKFNASYLQDMKQFTRVGQMLDLPWDGIKRLIHYSPTAFQIKESQFNFYRLPSHRIFITFSIKTLGNN